MTLPLHPVAAIEEVARHLGPLLPNVVFLGGSVVPLLITDPAATRPRPTEDVDVIVEATSRVRYDALGKHLRARGFRNDMSESAPICRWRTPTGLKVDVMPLDEHILGFSNRWYRLAIESADEHMLKELTIRVVTAAAFVATKLEAFLERGRGDYRASRDLEDLLTVIDGRRGIEQEIIELPAEAHRFIVDVLGRMLSHNDFLEAIPGHIEPGPGANERAALLENRLRTIASRGEPF